MRLIFLKTKKYIFGLICIASFIAGRSSAPKPKPEVRIIDNSKSVEKAIEDTQKQMNQALQKKIVFEKHIVKSKSGSFKTDIKKIITYNENSQENTNQITKSDIKISNQQIVEVKQKYQGIDYTFMVGRSFAEPTYHYFASIGVPLFAQIKANAGYEFQDKRIFLGATINF